MPDKITTRMGDGARVEMSAEQVKEDILVGTRDAADRGKIPELTPDELEQLFEIFADTNRIVAVKSGAEVITTDDGAAMTPIADQADGGVALPLSYMQSVLTYERVCCADIFGPAVNVKATRSTPWNLARAVTFVKETVKVANIPVHPNVGMGVCGLPMYESPPTDCTTRAAIALVEIGKADGL